MDSNLIFAPALLHSSSSKNGTPLSSQTLAKSWLFLRGTKHFRRLLPISLGTLEELVVAIIAASAIIFCAAAEPLSPRLIGFLMPFYFVLSPATSFLILFPALHFTAFLCGTSAYPYFAQLGERFAVQFLL